MPTVAEIMQKLPTVFDPVKGAGMTATIQMGFSADNNGLYLLRIADGKCAVEAGQIDQPDATMLTTGAVYTALATGQLDVMKAFMTGQLKVKGNLPLLMKLQQALNLSKVQP